MQQQNSQVPLIIIRVVAAALIAIHGWHRLLNNDVADLGDFIADYLPMGHALGWVVTILEAFGAPIFAAGGLIASGRLVFPLGLINMFVYTMAVLLYHLPHGWFTSGTNKDGCEYGVLLVAAFASVTWAHMPEGLKRIFRRKSHDACGLARHEL